MNMQKNLEAGTFASQGGEEKAFSYYSYYSVKNDTVSTKIFTAQLGDVNYTRLDQTNMPAPGQIPNSQKFVWNGISIRYVPKATKATADALLILNWLFTTAWEFWITDKTVMYQATLGQLMGLSLPMIQTTGAANIVLNSILSQAQPIHMLSKEITVAANNRFWVQITPGVAAGAQQQTDVDILQVGLHGVLTSRIG